MTSCGGVSVLDILRVVNPMLAIELTETLLDYSNTQNRNGEGVEMVEVTTGFRLLGIGFPKFADGFFAQKHKLEGVRNHAKLLHAGVEDLQMRL